MNYIQRFLPIFCVLLFTQLCFSQSQKYKGYPDRNIQDALPGFKQPPKGYGNVPFYWWNGDKLNKERLQEQLEILSASATDGFAVSYIHLDPKVDKEEMKDGYGLFGKTEAGDPKIFSEEWWDIWKWFTEACAQKGIGVGLDDYTVGWTGNGYYPDEVGRMSKFDKYQGELVITPIAVEGGNVLDVEMPENLLSVVAWPDNIDLTQQIKSGKLSWKAPVGKHYKVYVISTKKSYVIHPDHGKELIGVYFDRFEDKVGEAGKNGQNYFFQDELSYPISIGSWSEDFEAEFLKRKGYNILPFLPALKESIGDITPKIRLDYCDVLIDLAEERYFEPIYNWHAERGLIYGSDNLGRGMNPLAYVDYFRANSWYTAPGNDAPSKGSSFISSKVSSSIAHLNKRPRTWLEAFHSMGWSSSGEWLSQQTDHHFMAGGNLLCMHGLYYSTHGGWWEWAPPCFHFRMPYWPHMKQWLQYTERLSYLMSQGTHVCDIAIMYPTETMQAYPDTTPQSTFDVAQQLSNAGLDYDFMNYTALRNATISGGHMQASDEKYKIMVLVDMQAMHHTSLQKIVEHYRSGGIVLATGALPKASTKSGENDNEVDAIVKELFGLTADEASKGKTTQKQTNSANGVGMYIPSNQLIDNIQALIVPDFKPADNIGKVLHRQIGNRDVYMVMDVPQGNECFFRAQGKVEIWDAYTGETKDYPIVRQTEEGTWLRLDKEPSNSYLFVFSAGIPTLAEDAKNEQFLVSTITMGDQWEVELLPTMDNKWGDFRLPATNELIGAEARSFKHEVSTNSNTDWTQKDFDDSQWEESIYGFGVQMTEDTISSSHTVEDAVKRIKNGQSVSQPYEYSWQYGVWDNPGSQGWHGLKGKVSDGLFILNKGCHQIYRTQVYAPQNGNYRIETDGVKPDLLLINDKSVTSNVNLKQGWHQLLIAYGSTPKMEYESTTGAFHDFRERGAVVLFPQLSSSPTKNSPYADTISMRWGLGNHLMFDPHGGKHKQWNYRFRAVPGLEEMEFTVAGKNLKVWFDGEALSPANIQLIASNSKGINTYKVLMASPKKEVGTVAFSVDREIGYQGAAVLCEAVKLKTGVGLLHTGDWSKTGALKYYSGGMYYRNQFEMETVEVDRKVVLNLGAIVATCEIQVNGMSAGTLMSPPYEVDITPYLKTGTNAIQVLVYSTLSNHYQTIPTPYRGTPEAGLIGPVTLSVMENR